jgi:CubicO group peptidase (beta-lactamase class C family)
MRALILFVAACSSAQSQPRQVTSPPVAPVEAEPVAVVVPPVQQFAETDAGYAFTDPQRRKKLEAAFPAIDAALEAERIKQGGAPGFAIGIVIDGDLAYAKGFGVVALDTKAVPDADTVYRIGSISKSFTGLAAIALRDEGALGLDDPLVKWIPEAAGLVYPSRDAAPITVRQLLSHTSGLPRMGMFEAEKGPSEDVVVKSLAKLPLDTAPGERFSYSNLGFALAGIVVSHAGHASIRDVIAKRILKPAGMTSTFWAHEDVPAGRLAPAYEPTPTGPVPAKEHARLGAMEGAGGIYSTVRDMARYATVQLAAYPPRSERDDGPIRRASLREAHSTGVAGSLRVKLVGGAKPGEHTVNASAGAYGFGWGREQNCEVPDLVRHGGAIESYRSELMFSPSRGVGIVVLTNFGRVNASAIAERAFAELVRTGALAERRPKPVAAFESATKQFLAVYNQWDEAAYKAMLDPARRPVPEEQGELAGYKALHGACKSMTPKEIQSPREVRFAMQCERGTLEMDLAVKLESGLIDGFVGTSRGVAAPPELVKRGEAIATLVAKWDERVYKKHLAKGGPPHADSKALFAELRELHGSCKVRESVHIGFDWQVMLQCERGGELEVALTPNVRVQPAQRRLCPVR